MTVTPDFAPGGKIESMATPPATKSIGSMRLDARHYIALSIVTAVATILLKTGAWWVTRSVGLLSDALESNVNLLGAIFALAMIAIARTPPDDDHPYGHGKAEYFSSGFEGLLIIVAAIAIMAAAVMRLLAPQPVESLGIGLALSAVGTVLNFVVARLLAGAAKRYQSAALDADARHLMTDVVTSIGVVAGVLLVGATGIEWLDPLVAILVALHIGREGIRIVRDSADGLMDRALPDEVVMRITAVLDSYAARGVHYDSLRTRHGGAQSFVDVIVRVPGDWQVEAAHRVLDEIEAAIGAVVGNVRVLTHLEPTAQTHAGIDLG
ncbi:cation diffusion facilitator family transporter [soil metagenome]